MMGFIWLFITLSSAVSMLYMAFCTLRCILHIDDIMDVMDAVIAAMATVILFFITLFFYTLLVT